MTDLTPAIDYINMVIADIAQPDDRSKQVKIGPSGLGDPCDHCVAEQMARQLHPEKYTPDEPNLRVLTGTAWHLFLEKRFVGPKWDAIGHHREMKKLKVGSIEDYGEIVGTADAYSEEFATVLDYKGLALDTEIPTPTGWATMGTLREGDEVFDRFGSVCRVKHKSEVHYRDCYRITFDDKSSVVCDAEHRWITTSDADFNGKRIESVKTTQEIAETIFNKAKRPQRQHRVDIAGALCMPRVDLPIDPYVLGAWLGDGDSHSGRITKPDDGIFQEIERRGYAVSEPYSRRRPNDCQTRNIYGLAKQLRLNGLKQNKHIPSAYMRAGVQQRLDLLRGIMDTDGSWNKLRKQAVLTTVSVTFAHQVRELALSLGQRATVSPHKSFGFGKWVQAYYVQFRPLDINPFLLARKANLVEPTGSGVPSRRRIIVSVDKIPTVPTQCIEVDSPDSTYLCTRAFIPTHNTQVKASAQKMKRRGLGQTYDFQRHLYGKGVENAGLPIKYVGNLFIVTDGYFLSDIWYDVVEYDPTKADRALARASVIFHDYVLTDKIDDLGSDEDCFTCNRRF